MRMQSRTLLISMLSLALLTIAVSVQAQANDADAKQAAMLKQWQAVRQVLLDQEQAAERISYSYTIEMQRPSDEAPQDISIIVLDYARDGKRLRYDFVITQVLNAERVNDKGVLVADVAQPVRHVSYIYDGKSGVVTGLQAAPLKLTTRPTPPFVGPAEDVHIYSHTGIDKLLQRGELSIREVTREKIDGHDTTCFRFAGRYHEGGNRKPEQQRVYTLDIWYANDAGGIPVRSEMYTPEGKMWNKVSDVKTRAIEKDGRTVYLPVTYQKQTFRPDSSASFIRADVAVDTISLDAPPAERFVIEPAPARAD